VNVTDDHQRLRQRLHEEFGALEVSPPPILRVTGRGRQIRTRRRVLALGGLVILLAGGALSVRATTGHKAVPPAVTVNVPDPAAPGGVFASGTAEGKRWNLAVRNIAADPGTRWCLPAVMFNGRYGDVLYPLAKVTQLYGNPAYLADIPGFPGVGAIFTQVKPAVTKVTLTWPGGRTLTVRPVWVSGCAGQRFRLAGFAFANANGAPNVLTVGAYGEIMGLDLAPPGGLFGRTARGVWANTDKDRVDVASSRDAQPIGTGTVNGQIWHIRTSLGLFGQCYTATLRLPGHGRGQSSECTPVVAPPRVAALSLVTISGATTALPGYAGLVNPRTAKVEVALSAGIIPPARPVNIAGRAYVAFAVPPGCQVLQLKLFDSTGHVFAITTTVPLPSEH
jgi:hypothetical protein